MTERFFKVGWTAPIDHTMLKDGVAFDATALSAPTLVLVDLATGQQVPHGGSTAWQEITASKVRFTPSATTFDRPRKYRATYVLGEAVGQSMFPNEDDEIWEVRPL